METIKRFKNFLTRFCSVCKDNTNLLIKSAADNHLRIQQCGKDAQGNIQCAVTFSSYSELKRYQKKLRTATISLSSAIAMVLIAAIASPFIFNPNRSSAAIYSWTQTMWKAVPTGTTGDSSKVDFADYASRDALVSLTEGTDPLSKVTLAEENDDVNQTNDVQFNSGTHNNTAVDGTGDAAALTLAQAASDMTAIATDNSSTIASFAQQGGWGYGSFSQTSQDGTVGEGASIQLSQRSGAVFSYASPSRYFNVFNYPNIAIDSGNNVYVGDSGFSKILKFDSGGNFIKSWGSFGGGDGQFNAPKGIAVGPDGSVYVADSGNNRIQKFSSNGDFILKWGSAGSGDGQFSQLTGIAVDGSGNVYSGEAGNDRIQKFTANGSFVTKWGSNGDGNGQFRSIIDLTVDPGGNVYAYDRTVSLRRIQKFDSSGTFLLSFGSYGTTANGTFAGDVSLGSDSSGNIYTAENDTGSGGKRIQKFTSGGVFVSKWVTTNYLRDIAIDSSGNMWVTGEDEFLTKYNSSGSQILSVSNTSAGQINSSRKVAIDSGGNLYVLDALNNRIQKFDRNGVFVAMWGSYGTGNGQFNSLKNITVGPDNIVYVLDGEGSATRVQKFTSGGSFVASIIPAANSAIESPIDIEIDGSGNILIFFYYNDTDYGEEGTLLKRYNASGTSPVYLISNIGSSIKVTAFDLDQDGNIYVVSDYNKVVKYGPNGGVYSSIWGNTGSGDGYLSSPNDIHVNTDGTLYIADTGNNRIQKFTTTGTFISKFGSSGANNGQFASPRGVVADNSGNVWIADTENNRVQKFYDGVSYYESGTYTSYFDAGGVNNHLWKNISWGGNYPAGTSLVLKVKGTSSSSAPDFGTGSCTLENIGLNGSLELTSACVTTGNRYLWYQVSLVTQDITKTPKLDSLTAIATIPEYLTPGSFVSEAIDAGSGISSGGNISWTNNAGQHVNVRVRSDDNNDFSDAKEWDLCTDIVNGENISTGGCVDVGHRYLQYRAVLSTDDIAQTPRMDDITLGFSRYPTANQVLISSPYDSGDQYNMLSKVRFTADQTGGSVKFQLRAAPTTEGLAAAQWCGPASCAANPGQSGSFFTDPLGGEEMNAALSDYQNKDNRYFQYAAFLASTDGSGAPILDEVTIDYSYNKSPHLTNVSATQRSDGMVEVGYTIREEEGEAVYPILAYNPQGVVLAEDIDAVREGDVAINSNSQPIPQSGQMIIGDELIQFVRKDANTLTISPSGRALKFDGATYYTVAGAHATGTPIYFKANRASGEVSREISLDPEYKNIEMARAALWDIKQEIADGVFAGPTFASRITEGVTFRILANDAQTHNNVGSGSSNSLSIDLEAPTVSSIGTTTETGRYRQGQVIPLALQFSEPVSTPGQQEVVTNTGYACLIYVDPATEASCDYVVQGADNTEQLTAALSSTATIKDVYGNVMTNRAAAIDNVISKNIVIDNAKPVANFSAPLEGSFVNKGEVKFTLSEELSNATLKFTATSSENGETAGSVHTLALSGAELTTLGQQTKEIPGLINGNTYTLSLAGTDIAGNVSDEANGQVSGITFDTRKPDGSVEGPSAIESKVYFNEDADIKITADEILRTNAFGENQQDKNYLKFTNTQTSQETICTFSEQLISLFPAEDHALDFGTDCGGMTLGEGEYALTLHLIDRAGNSKDLEQTGFVYDVTAPRVFSFTSSTDNTCGGTACGTSAEINITAVMTEPVVSGSMQVRLANTATPATDVTLSNISATDVSGTYVVQGPNLGHDTDDLAISEVRSANLVDRAGNVQADLSIPSGRNLSDNKNIVIDTGPPVLDAFSAPAGNYNAGDSFTVTADYSERLSTLNGGSSVRVTFTTGKSLELTAISSDKLTGTYTVEDGENAESFAVTAIEAQNAVDLIGNPLTAQDLPPTNIAGVQVDTEAPTLGVTAVSFAVAKTNSQTPTVNLDASDNFDLADGVMRYSLNGGTSWCAPVPYAMQTNSFDITAGACGGNAANGIKTLTVKFSDAAGNESVTASAQIEYDNSKPVLEKITTEQGSGIYGPADQLKVIAQYNEPLFNGSTLTINLNNGKQITLSAIENSSTLTAVYTVGNTGSLEDTNKLKVASIVSQSVSDTASPTNTQDSTSLAGIAENIDSNKDIVIDTSAPTSSLKLDRAAEEGKIKVALDPDDGGVDRGGMNVQIALLESDASCSFAGAITENFTEFPQVFSYDDANSQVRKACVKLTDGAGNISSEISAVTPSTPEDFVYTDLTNGGSGFVGAILTWDIPASEGTGNFAKYALKWCSSSDKGDCTPSENVEITGKEQNYHVFNSLSTDNGYCYKVSFVDANGDISRSSQTHCAVPGEGPKASGTDVAFENPPFVGSVGMDTATVVFKTVDDANGGAPLATTTVVEAYEDSSLTNLKASATDSLGVTHAVKLTGLSSNTTYYLKITATDTSDEANSKRSETVSYSTGSALTFETLGTLSKITLSDKEPSVVTDTKAVISFVTDQAAKCFVEYKEKAIATYSEVNNVPEAEARKNHSIAIGSLLPSTEYDFKVTCSADGVVVGPVGGKSFVTRQAGTGEDEGGDGVAPTISGVSLAEITGETATVKWSTDEKANSLVIYEVEGGDYSMMTGNSLVNDSVEHFTTSHSVRISDLIPATKYAFSVVSYDSVGNISQSDRTVFTTKEPSSLSSIQVVSKALGQATVTWQTSEATSSIVEYGKTTAYGDKKESSTKTKEHELTVTDLEPGETYHFRVKGEDDAKNLYASSDITFQPKAPPKISDFKVDEVYEHGATISFVTNVPTDALIAYADAQNEENSGLQGRPDYMTKHAIKLIGLVAGTDYSLTVTVRDEEGNETKETFPQFKTLLDEKDPEIDKVKTDAALTQSDKVQAIISWSTDEPATTTIVYREGRSGDKKELKVSDSLSTNHVAVVTTFKPGTVYYFNVESADASGNKATSNDFALLTPRRRENIIQVIVNNFQQIFGWVQR